jgi:hypothetical protein
MSISKQLLGDTHQPLPVGPGKPEWRDYRCERDGIVVNLLLFCEPLRGSRWVGCDRAAHQD